MAVPIDFSDPNGMLRRIEALYRAVEIDPAFALAWFNLTNGNSWLYAFSYDTSEERRRLALEAARRVEEIAPGSALAAAAMGNYQYRVERDYDQAFEDLTRAIELDPNLSIAFWMHGSVLRRMAKFEAAVESYRSAVALDPRSTNSLTQLGIAYQYLRRYEQAIDTFDRVIALPDDPRFVHNAKVETFWSWADHLAAARQTLEAVPMQLSPVVVDYLWYWQAVYEGDFRAAIDRVEMSREEWLGMPVYFRPRALLEGLARLWQGERDLAHQQFEKAVVKLQARLFDAPDSEKLLSSLGVALAALGRRDQAIEAAHRATEIVPLATDPWFGQTHVEDLAWVYTLLGDYDSAIDQLEILLERPSLLTVSFLKMDPRWEPLWDHPRFKELEEKYG